MSTRARPRRGSGSPQPGLGGKEWPTALPSRAPPAENASNYQKTKDLKTRLDVGSFLAARRALEAPAGARRGVLSAPFRPEVPKGLRASPLPPAVL